MLSNLFAKTLRDQRLAIFGGSAGLVALAFYLAYVYPYIHRAKDIAVFIDKMPPFLKNLINPEVLTSPGGFFNLQPFSILAPLIFLAYAIARGSDVIAGEEERGTLDLLLAGPISRGRLLIQKWLATSLVLAIMAAALGLGMTIGCWVFAIPLQGMRLASALFSCWLLAMVFFSLSLALGCLTGRKRASAAVASTFAVLVYLIQSYAPVVESLRPWRKFSPFFYYNGNTVLLNGLDWGHVAIQAATVFVLTLLALLFFRRRDLRA